MFEKSLAEFIWSVELVLGDIICQQFAWNLSDTISAIIITKLMMFSNRVIHTVFGFPEFISARRICGD